MQDSLPLLMARSKTEAYTPGMILFISFSLCTVAFRPGSLAQMGHRQYRLCVSSSGINFNQRVYLSGLNASVQKCIHGSRHKRIPQ